MTVIRGKGYARRRRRPGRALYIAAAAFGLVLLALAAALLIGGGKEEYYTLVTGSLQEPERFTAVCLRDESVAAAEEVGRIEYVAAEGEHIEAESNVLRVNKTGYSEKTLQELADIQQKILSYQVNNIVKDTIDNELVRYNAEIESVIGEIAKIVRNESTANILEYEARLKEAMEKRRVHLRSTCQPDSELTKLYQQESSYIDRISIVSEYFKSSFAGIISFYFDGYEVTLVPSQLQELSFGELVDISQGKGAAMLNEQTAYTQLYRLVNPDNWYLLVLSAGGDIELSQGQSLAFTLDGYEGRDVRGVVSGSRAEENGDTVYWVKMQSNIEPFLSVRSLEGQIYKMDEGFKVPVSSVSRKQGFYYVSAVIGGSQTEVQVEIIARNDKYAIISEKGTSYLVNGLKIKQ